MRDADPQGRTRIETPPKGGRSDGCSRVARESKSRLTPKPWEVRRDLPGFRGRDTGTLLLTGSHGRRTITRSPGLPYRDDQTLTPVAGESKPSLVHLPVIRSPSIVPWNSMSMR